MDRVILNDLNFENRNEALNFLKSLWKYEKSECPICGSKLELLHKKAKKNNCDWQCKSCNKIYKQFIYWMKLIKRCRIDNFIFE